MGENSKIEWTDHTFNPWIGCTKVSPACAHCYAENSPASRFGGVRWGPGQPRKRTAASNWKQPVTWNRKAEAAGVRPRVFCASLADVFDDAVPVEWRRDLLHLIDDTPHLDWLLLTKRPADVPRLLSQVSNGAVEDFRHMPNVWLGTTVEDQRRADERLDDLLNVPARVHFVSAEPLLGPLDLRRWFGGLDWVIAGGESGHGARPSHPDWYRSLRDQCEVAGVAFHFKQWGEFGPTSSSTRVERVGKAAAGRILDGRTHDGLPSLG